MSNKKRAKNEPTKGDLLAQAYRNRAAMHRVYDSATRHHKGVIALDYWTPCNMDQAIWIQPLQREVTHGTKD